MRNRLQGCFSWEWVHLELDAEALYNNIFIAAEMGAEFAPHHLHAMPSSKLPRARTGVAFGIKRGEVDNAPKEHHQDGIWLRHDLRDFIQAKVLSDTIMKLGIFKSKLS